VIMPPMPRARQRTRTRDAAKLLICAALQGVLLMLPFVKTAA
jgi:hypothetical protein